MKFDASLQLRDQLYLLKNVSKGWEKLDPTVRIALLPVLNTLLPESFSRARQNLRREVPLNRATAQSITRRVEWIKEFEGVATTAMELPWIRLRASVLHELSGAYLDFCATLKNLPVPKDVTPADAAEYQKSVKEIVEPFLKKSHEIAERSYLLASRSSVEDVVLKPIEEASRDSWKMQSAQLQKKLPQWKSDSQVAGLDLGLMRILEPKSPITPGSALLSLWRDSLQKQQWEKNAFLFQELKSKKVLSATELRFMQGLILVASGAKAEGLLELKTAAADLESAARKELDHVLLSHYAHSLSVDTAVELAEEMDKLTVKLVSVKSGGQS